ncbi:MAG TPA: L,D-transpeptidase family protein [Longimicrobiales bacterium]|nr:L,D-transpeptidase family protein [Longimicrobiales bacterium]
MRRGVVAIVVTLTACGGNESGTEDVAREPRHRLEALLSQAPDSGVSLTLTAGDTVHVSAQTLAYYRRVRFRPAWLDGSQVSERGRGVHAVLRGAEQDGLAPARYRLETATRLLGMLSAEDAAEALDAGARAGYLADIDLLLSEGYMRYATDIVTGTIDPEQVGRAWRVHRDAPPTELVLRSAVRGDPAQIVQRLRPATPNYGRLMRALARLREVQAAGGWPALPAGIKAAEGDSSAAVGALRARLAASDDAREAMLARQGAAQAAKYDRDLRDALRHFQTRHGLDDDGKLGGMTLVELQHPVEERIAEVRLNLDRWRWLPRELGDLFVLVNIAGFELEVVENNRTIEAMNVVVGKIGNETPVFADTMEHVVVNPYWNVPTSILKEEILPAIARDPGYLARNNMEWVGDGGVRQRPGRDNALGKVKFLFPNSNNIYLHDTPADHLFARARRDFSHGCIRVERPLDLARLIVSKATNHSPSSLQAMLNTTTEKWINLKRPIPVYITYFTAWVGEDGTLRFHHDIYGHDVELLDTEGETRAERVARVGG